MQNENAGILFKDLAKIIEQFKYQAVDQVNSVLTLTYWHVGKKINDHILENKRAEYGEKVVSNVSSHLAQKYGNQFGEKNVRRMMRFAEVFSDFAIVAPVVRQLSWSHFLMLLPLKSEESRMYYAQKTIEERWSKRTLSYQIERKAFERNEIANAQAVNELQDSQNTFKDPYFLDFFGLKDGHLEKDLEMAIIKELEFFILELGVGFTFVERQKRMIIDGQDFYLDLLFYHRKLQRLVVIELKLGEFKPSYKRSNGIVFKMVG